MCHLVTVAQAVPHATESQLTPVQDIVGPEQAEKDAEVVSEIVMETGFGRDLQTTASKLLS